MSKRELTPWFPETVKPTRPGVYLTEVVYIEGDFSYFDGERWYCAGDTPDQALNLHRHHMVSGYKGKAWRGLAKEPA